MGTTAVENLNENVIFNEKKFLNVLKNWQKNLFEVQTIDNTLNYEFLMLNNLKTNLK